MDKFINIFFIVFETNFTKNIKFIILEQNIKIFSSG